MSKIVAAIGIGVLALTLTGCDRPKTNFDKCIEAGGSYESTAWGGNCAMPTATPGENREEQNHG
jgi:hypothetical protein